MRRILKYFTAMAALSWPLRRDGHTGRFRASRVREREKERNEKRVRVQQHVRYADGEYYERLAPLGFSHVRKHAGFVFRRPISAHGLEKHPYVFSLRHQPNQTAPPALLERLPSRNGKALDGGTRGISSLCAVSAL